MVVFILVFLGGLLLRPLIDVLYWFFLDGV